MKNRRVILLVEDDPNDVFFLERALEENRFDGRLVHLGDAEDARHYLSGAGKFADREQYPMPYLVIADSALTARGSGVELLEWSRANLEKQVPFVILSGGVEQPMRERAEAAGVKRVMTKAANYKQTAQQLREIFAELDRTGS